MAKRWYIVHVYSGFEKKVAQSIREQAIATGLDDQIGEVLVPTEEVLEMRRGQKVSVERKFFPGYVMANIDLNDETWHLIKNTSKVTWPTRKETMVTTGMVFVMIALMAIFFFFVDQILALGVRAILDLGS